MRARDICTYRGVQALSSRNPAHVVVAPAMPEPNVGRRVEKLDHPLCHIDVFRKCAGPDGKATGCSPQLTWTRGAGIAEKQWHMRRLDWQVHEPWYIACSCALVPRHKGQLVCRRLACKTLCSVSRQAPGSNYDRPWRLQLDCFPEVVVGSWLDTVGAKLRLIATLGSLLHPLHDFGGGLFAANVHHSHMLPYTWNNNCHLVTSNNRAECSRSLCIWTRILCACHLGNARGMGRNTGVLST